MKRSVLLVGGRSKAKALAQSLLQKGYQVTAVNAALEDCQKLAENGKLSVIHGDGTKPYVLEDAGAGRMDMAIALTPRDEDNLVICQLCKKRFQVKKTVALLSDPQKTEFFYKMGIDSVVCAISAVTSIIEQQAFVEEMAKAIPIGAGRVQMLEIPITASDPVTGKQVWEIDLPKEVIIGCILRGDRNLVPRGDTRILAGDVLVLISGSNREAAAVRALKGDSKWRS
ncbi:MAG: NAD-binding protein [Candidatus Faecousia sp.]|nr:NAD-binding protein [Clostridiales bacterium]MDD7651366.1 NAD-binding protein [Bacillota bacterium]MDY4219468.1 NAD-binding protein [Candidatus Faecousia sp.]